MASALKPCLTDLRLTQLGTALAFGDDITKEFLVKKVLASIVLLSSFSAVAGTDYCVLVKGENSVQQLGMFATTGPLSGQSERQSTLLQDSDGEVRISISRTGGFKYVGDRLELNMQLSRGLTVIVAKTVPGGQDKMQSMTTMMLPGGGSIFLYDSKGKALTISCGTDDK